MRTLTLLTLCLLSSSLAGCASSGRKFDTSRVDEVITGTTTKAEIRTWFGEPFRAEPVSGTGTGATERWTYVYAHSTAGLSTTAESLIVDFDDRDVVCDHAFVRR